MVAGQFDEINEWMREQFDKMYSEMGVPEDLLGNNIFHTSAPCTGVILHPDAYKFSYCDLYWNNRFEEAKAIIAAKVDKEIERSLDTLNARFYGMVSELNLHKPVSETFTGVGFWPSQKNVKELLFTINGVLTVDIGEVGNIIVFRLGLSSYVTRNWILLLEILQDTYVCLCRATPIGSIFGFRFIYSEEHRGNMEIATELLRAKYNLDNQSIIL